MDLLSTYGIQILDVGFIIFLFIILFSNLPLHRMMGAFKGIIFIVILWFIAKILSLSMAETILSQIIQYGFLGIIILYPMDFKKLLENVGRRRFFNSNINSLISPIGRKELAKGLIQLARNKDGAIVVIAKGDNLDEEVETGMFVGEMDIKHEFIEMIFHKESKVKDGAVIIKDDEIIATNCRLPIAEFKGLRESGAGDRHLAGVGVVSERDCIALVVSGSQATISVIGYKKGKLFAEYSIPLKEENHKEGITEESLVTIMEQLLKDTTRKQAKRKTKQKPQQKKKVKSNKGK